MTIFLRASRDSVELPEFGARFAIMPSNLFASFEIETASQRCTIQDSRFAMQINAIGAMDAIRDAGSRMQDSGYGGVTTGG